MSSAPSHRVLRVTSVLLRLGLGLGIIGVAVGIFAFLASTRPAPAMEPGRNSIPVVSTMEVRPVEVGRSWIGHGVVRAMRAVDIPAQVAARVETRLERIEDGARVTANEAIVTLEQADFERQLTSAQQRADAVSAQLRSLEAERIRWEEQARLVDEEVGLRQRELQRITDAVSQGAGTDADVDGPRANLARSRREAASIWQQLEMTEPRRVELEARLAVESAQAAIAQENLDRTTISAPFDGFLQRVEFRKGEYVPAGARVARIVDLSHLEIPLRIPLAAAGHIKPGDRVVIGDASRFDPDGTDSTLLAGVVARIAPEASTTTRSMTVFVEVSQSFDPEAQTLVAAGEAGSVLLPGQYVVARVFSSGLEQRLIVPRRAIVDDRVFIAASAPEDDRGLVARAVGVTIAYHLERDVPELDPSTRQWSVLDPVSELKAGMRVITSDLDEIDDGVAILPNGGRSGAP